MSRSSLLSSGSHREGTKHDSAFSIQEAIREVCSAGPGIELADLLRLAFDRGAPVWHGLEGVVVPRLAVLEASADTGGLDWKVVDALGAGSQLRFDRAWEDSTAEKEIKRLAAAVYCDLLGLSDLDAAELLGYAADAEGRARGLEEVKGRGRELWTRLGAWPWWCWQPPDGKLPDGWWDQESVQQTLLKWCAKLLPYPLPPAPASLASPLPRLAP